MNPPDPRTLKFLVVDDESFVRTLTVRLLGTLGYQNVDTAENGARALEQLAAAPDYFDIIICDLNMPEMDGVEFMRHAAGQNFSGGFIFLSGEDTRLLDTARDLAKAHDLNILGAIPKPLKPDALRDLLGKLMTPRKPRPFEKQVSITETELRAGIGGPDLRVVFQPKVNTATMAVDGVETLVRWQHPERGLLGPGAFLPLAEILGLMDDITDDVYRKAMQQAGAWLAAGIKLSVSVNFPVNTFTRPGFADFLVDIARSERVDPALVVLEVTENQVMQNALDCLEVLMRLRMKKFGLSIDDFGTGQSSLEQLRRIPFNELKIDRAFVHGAAADESSRAILESSADLARKLKLQIVAEGAEVRSDWDIVAKNGCDYVQGYYCARPMSPDELLKFLAGWKGPH